MLSSSVLPDGNIIQADILVLDDRTVAQDVQRKIEILLRSEYGQPVRRLHLTKEGTREFDVYGTDTEVALDSEKEQVAVGDFSFYRVGSVYRGTSRSAFEQIVERIFHMAPDHITLAYLRRNNEPVSESVR